MAISTPTGSVNPSSAHPAYCILRAGDRPSCIFPYEGEAGDKFVADMVAAGWTADLIDDCMVLGAPEGSNITPFPRHMIHYGA